MRAQVRERGQLLSCILGFCQHFGIHNHLIELGAGGTFAGCLVCSGGFFWQPDIFYLVGDLSHARSEDPETTVFIAVREGVLAVRSTLSPGRHRLFTTRRPTETVEHVEERCGMADRATLESLKGRCFDFITVLDTRFPVAGLIGMNRKQAHRDIAIGQWVRTDGLELLQISFSPELWAQLHDSYQSLKELRPAEGYGLGFLFHYRPYRNPGFSASHESFGVEFYHDQHDSKPVILPEVLDTYRSAKDTANIFIQNRDGQNFGADHLLGWWPKHKDKELRDCVPESVKHPEGASETVPFEINFLPNSFHMLSNQGPLDIKRLTLFVRFTWVPTSATPRPT